MQSAPRDAVSGLKNRRTPRVKLWFNGAIILLIALLCAGYGIAAFQIEELQVRNTKIAKDYEPSTSYTPPEVAVEVAFLGDSFTAGARASSKAHRWTTLLAREQGWIELNYGQGGTNYGTGSPVTGGSAYAERLTDIVVSQPDIVIISTAGNSLGQNQKPGIRETFQSLRDQLPSAHIVATSPYYGDKKFPHAFDSFSGEIRREVEAVDGVYLDIGHPLLGRAEAIAEDGGHPNDDGYELLAEAIGNALEKAKIAELAPRQ